MSSSSNAVLHGVIMSIAMLLLGTQPAAAAAPRAFFPRLLNSEAASNHTNHTNHTANVSAVDKKVLSRPPHVNTTEHNATLPHDFNFTLPVERRALLEEAAQRLPVGSHATRRLQGGLFNNAQMQYWGGDVMVDTVNVYMIYIGFAPTDGVPMWINYMVAHIDSTDYYRPMNRLYSIVHGKNTSVNAKVRLAGATYLTPKGSVNLGAEKTDVQSILAVISYVMDNKLTNVSDPNGLYLVVPAFSDANPKIITFSDPKAPVDGPGGSCGWHSENNNIKFGYVPQLGPSMVAGCSAALDVIHPDGTFSPSGDTSIDALTDTVAHEIIEAVSDPAGERPGWAGANAAGTQAAIDKENGDLCNSIYDARMLPTATTPAMPASSGMFPNMTVPDGSGRNVFYNVQVGGYPYWMQANYLIDINPHDGMQYGCVLGVTSGGKVILHAK